MVVISRHLFLAFISKIVYLLRRNGGFEGRSEKERMTCLRPTGNWGKRGLGFPVREKTSVLHFGRAKSMAGAQREAWHGAQGG